MSDELRTTGEIAEALLSELFASSHRVLIRDAVAAGQSRGVGRKTLVSVAQEMRVKSIFNGRRPGFWER